MGSHKQKLSNSLLLFIMFFLLTLCTTSKSKRIITRMIHHSSIQSPFFNASETMEQLSRREMNMFHEHIHHLRSAAAVMKGSDYYQTMQAIEATVISRPISSLLFLVKLQIGDERPISQLLSLDTGSSLLWVGDGGFFNSNLTKSSTYKEVACEDALCKSYLDVQESCADGSVACPYQVNYMTGYSKGVLATETFKFSTERTESEIPGVVFGCASHVADGVIRDAVTGVMGLGPKPVSLLRQKGYSRFSYCIGNLTDPTYTENVLIINDDALLDSQSTAIYVVRDHYAAIIEQISVGGKVLDIVMPVDERRFATFDTGASVSLLTEPAYLQVEDAVITTIGNYLKRSESNSWSPDQLCYEGVLHRDLYWFPTMAFHFKGAVMEFSYENLFRQYTPDVLCLGVMNARKHNFLGSLIGVNLQQYFYVFYDIDRKRMNMERLDCEIIYD